MIKIQWLASIWRQNDQKCSVTSQNIQNYAKLQNRSNYIELHRLDGKTIKTKLKLNYKSHRNPMTSIDFTAKRSKCWVTSQNIQNNAKLQNQSNYIELHRLDGKTIKTTQNYKSNQITMTCIDWMSKRSKQRKTTKVIKLQWLACINVKTIKTKLNYKSDQNPMTCIDLTSKRSKQS